MNSNLPKYLSCEIGLGVGELGCILCPCVKPLIELIKFNFSFVFVFCFSFKILLCWRNTIVEYLSA